MRFEYEVGTDVYQSCAVTFLGEFWIFGGESGKKDRLDFQLFIEDFIEDYIQYLKYYISIQGEQSEQESM